MPETYRPRLGGFSNSDYSLEFGGIKPDKMSANSIFVGKLNLQYPVIEMLRSHLYMNANMSFARVSNKSYHYGKEQIKSYGIGIGTNIHRTNKSWICKISERKCEIRIKYRI